MSQPQTTMRREQLVAMYSAYPQALEELLTSVFSAIGVDIRPVEHTRSGEIVDYVHQPNDTTKEQCIALHNQAIFTLLKLCPRRDLVLQNVAQAILTTATAGVQGGT